LNWGPSDFQSPDSASNIPENKANSHKNAAGRSAGRSDLQSEGIITDPELARLVAAWPKLPDHIRQAIQTLVRSAFG
jgi:hypothetical protein